MKRLDAALVELGLAPSRSKAQQMIEAGEVEISSGSEWRRIEQCSFSLKADSKIRLADHSQTLKYVSRGGLKLEGALKHLSLEVKGFRCLDIGISTGGFSDCLLKQGALQILGVDVGHDQLATALKKESKLKQIEGLNVRALADSAEVCEFAAQGIDLCVVDVAFISLELVLPPLSRCLAQGTRLLALVKPQFEVGAANLDKNGVVRDETLFASVEALVLRALEKCGFSRVDYFASNVKGQDGNQEFFVYATRA
jgi:23S rRNA (cytidine1920-2'-O)/16S rRNA (cytidine1409-2'-O)-methyltransferase